MIQKSIKQRKINNALMLDFKNLLFVCRTTLLMYKQAHKKERQYIVAPVF